MRSLVIVLITIGVLGGAFFFYALMQTAPPAVPVENVVAKPVARPPTPSPKDSASPAVSGPTTTPVQAASSVPGAPQPSDAPNQRIIGAGDNVWVRSYDATSGELKNEFRAARYEPTSDDTVNVTQPQARFHFGEGAVLLIEAARGRVVVPASSGQRETLRDSRGQMPTRGELYDVTITLLKTAEATDPIVRCTMNNITFDNDTYRIATEAFTDASGRTIPANQVPIVLRGAEYDFDGFGLSISWNEVDRRLQRLEITRGEQLVVKNPKALKLAGVEPKDGAATAQPSHPIVIRWAGPLRIIPGKTPKGPDKQRYRTTLTDQVRITQAAAEVASADELEIAFTIEPKDTDPSSSSDRMPVDVSLTGAPAIVQMRGMQARAAVVTYDTVGGSAVLKSSPEFPQIGLQDSAGRTMLARQVDYDAAGGVATLTGPAKFELPLPEEGAEAGDAPRMLVADAKKQCIVRFDANNDQAAVRSATLVGDVTIDHPQLRLACQTIDLSFDQEAEPNQPGLSGMQADGAVQAVLLDKANQSQKIECRTLALKTRRGEGGRISAESLHAQGDVRIDTPQQQISAQDLELAFAPRAEQGAAESMLTVGEDQIVALRAENAVKLRSTGGASIIADRVTLGDSGAEKGKLRIEGKPAGIGDGRGMLAADLLLFDPVTGDADIVGGGRFDTTFAGTEGQPGRPAAISWTGNVHFDSSAGAAAINNGVSITSDQPDGTQVKGSADSLTLAFDSSPSTQPSASPLAGRQVRDVNLIGDVQFAAMQLNPGGDLAQRMHLYCDKLIYRPKDGAVVVPVGGRMLVEDRRPEAAKARTAQSLGSPRGATAFQWSDKLSFAPEGSTAQMTGDVLVVHRPMSPDAQEMRLSADTVAAELAAPLKSAGSSQSGGVSQTALDSSQLRSVKATGNVRFDSNKLEFFAAEVEMRPQEDQLIARGTDRAPAVLLDEQGLSRGSFLEMWLNTRTQESHLKDFRATVRR